MTNFPPNSTFATSTFLLTAVKLWSSGYRNVPDVVLLDNPITTIRLAFSAAVAMWALLRHWTRPRSPTLKEA